MNVLTKADGLTCPHCGKSEVYHDKDINLCVKCKHKFTDKESKKAYEEARKKWNR